VNTFGAWTQIIASTAAGIDALRPLVGSNGVGIASATWVFEVGTGPAASEVAVADFTHRSGSILDDFSHWLPLQAQIPASTRISVRAKCSSITAGIRTRDVGFIYATKP